jgi:hypothetical protein
MKEKRKKAWKENRNKEALSLPLSLSNTPDDII